MHMLLAPERAKRSPQRTQKPGPLEIQEDD